MSNSWVLSQLAHADEETIELVCNKSPYLQDLWMRHLEYNLSNLIWPLVILILSWCDLKDVCSLVLVCKQWAEAPKEKTFWARHVMRRLMQENSDPLWQRRYKSVVDLDFYATTISIRTKYTWLFPNQRRPPILLLSPEKEKAAGEGQMCLISYPDNLELIYWFGLDSEDCSQYGLFPRDQEGHGIRYYHSESVSKLKMLAGPVKKNTRGFKESVYDIIYDDGSLSYKGKAIGSKPHGAGTWTWHVPKGRTFSGDNVAFGGVPHGTGVDEHGETVTYVAGYRKDELEESFVETKRRRIDDIN